MLPVVRHDTIVDAVNSASTVSTDELVQLLGVSAETVRRDLALLEERGALRRVHGGAASVHSGGRGEEPSYTERTAIRHQAKAELARVGAGLLESGQTVIIDIGTTAVELARAVPPDFRGTVATPSLLVAAELAGRPGVDVLVAGGRVRGGDLACSNAHTKAFFTGLYADIAFIGSGGVDISAGLTDYHLDEIDVRHTVIANSARSFILADSSKLGQVAPHRVCGLTEVSGLITDAVTAENTDARDIATVIREAGGAVLVA